MIDREALCYAVNALADALNAGGADETLRPSTRVLAPLLSQILADAEAEIAADVRRICDSIFGKAVSDG